MTINELNNISQEQAYSAFEKCCVSKSWINGVLNSMSFDTADDLYQASDKSWSNCKETDWLEAFTGHPKIGDISSLAKKFSNTHGWAGHEQSGMNTAEMDVIKRLSLGNNNYADKFGFIFIVCAKGKSAQEMLDLLEQRLPNNRKDELQIAAVEQHKITRIRLEKLLAT
ncbi:MAG: 2-oxo-4-hydroxy-4-carboxy-5-ureidoimidazoline decarboxylase [Flavobacteriales bacterium]|nr:2-oxo-4-hydroxy-4-carboxy-5-ureidoimidazoline decarboxylase [Flavobacteriales bacterium]